MTKIVPTYSTSFAPRQAQLIENLVGVGVSRVQIESFLRDAEAPDDLRALGTYARKLTEKILSLHLRSSDPDFQHWAKEWFHIAKSLCELPPPIAEVEWFLQIGEKNPNAMRRYYGTHPSYCLVLHGCEDPANRARHNQFLAQFLFKYRTFKLGVTGREYLLETVCLAARRLGSKQATVRKPEKRTIALTVLSSILGNLPGNALSPSDYARRFREVCVNQSPEYPEEIEYTAIRHIDFVLSATLPGSRKAAPDREFHASNHGSSSEIVGGYDEPLYLTTAPLPGDDAKVIVLSQPAAYSAHCDPTEGLDPEDTRPTRTFAKVRQKSPTYSNSQDQLIYIGAANRSSILARIVNSLPLDTNSLNSFEIGLLVKHLEAAARAPNSGDALLALLFGSGLPLNFTLATHLTRKSIGACRGQQYTYCKGGELTFPVWSGQQQMRLPAVHKQHTAPHVTQIIVHLADAIADILDCYVEKSDIDIGNRLFLDHDEARRAASDTLCLINAEFGVELTLGKISGFLYRRIANLPAANESAAVHITGQPDHCGYQGSTYTSWPITSLDQILQETWRRVGTYAGLSKSWTSARIEIHKLPDNASCGSRLAPKPEVIRSYFKELQKDVRSASNCPPHDRAFLKQLESYMRNFYSTLILLTGGRSVSNPVLHPNLIGHSSGWLYSTSKDSDSYYHAHLIPLPPALEQLFEYHEAHKDALVERWMSLNTSEASRFKWQKPKNLTNHRDRDKESSNVDPRTTFKIAADGTLQQLAPKEVMRGFTAFTGLQENSLRHYFCTRLQANGCPPEVIRALMGHWRLGEEPWCRFSAMDPIQFRCLAVHYISELVKEVKLRLTCSPLLK